MIQSLGAFMTKDKLPLILALTVTIGFISLLWLLAFHEVPSTSHDILMASAGTLGTAFAGIVAYYFGSSAGSTEKTRIMANQGVGKPDTTKES